MRWSRHGRFSTDMHNPTSIEQQLRICRGRYDREGSAFVGACSDRAMTGTTHLRPGYQRRLEDARNDKFDVIVAEAVDRTSPDQVCLARLYERLTSSGVDNGLRKAGLGQRVPYRARWHDGSNLECIDQYRHLRARYRCP
jgi:site-specific DNA recombinase